MKKSKFYNLAKNEVESLQNQRDAIAEWLFTHTLGKVVNSIISRPLFSILASHYLKSSWSLKKIESFKYEFGIDDTDFENAEYQSLNDYFIRKFKPHARSFSRNEWELSSPAEGYYLVSSSAHLPVKGVTTTPKELLDCLPGFEIKQSVVIRLSPKEYHRLHFPFSGVIKSIAPISGRLYSINPVTLKYDQNLFIKNKRIVLELAFDNGVRAYCILIGATYIGSIQLSVKAGDRFLKGDEFGYFEFGGSTAVLLIDTKLNFEEKILSYSEQGIETFAKLGQTIAIKYK